jgi:hypothetical protein
MCSRYLEKWSLEIHSEERNPNDQWQQLARYPAGVRVMYHESHTSSGLLENKSLKTT